MGNAWNYFSQDRPNRTAVCSVATPTGGGPSAVWMPMNAVLLRALLSYYLYYGDNFKVECPTGSGNRMNLFEVAREISNRLSRIFLGDESGRRPVYGGTRKFQIDPHWKDYLLFYEYFHGDNGAGLGAKLIEFFSRIDGTQFLTASKAGAFVKEEPAGARDRDLAALSRE
jgi:hypothetical protein